MIVTNRMVVIEQEQEEEIIQIKLDEKEEKLLKLFRDNPNKTFSRKQIMQIGRAHV